MALERVSGIIIDLLDNRMNVITANDLSILKW